VQRDAHAAEFTFHCLNKHDECIALRQLSRLPSRRANARLRTPLRGTNFESAPSPALFNESMTTCTTLVHTTLGTYMHASFTQCIDPSGPMYASCAPAEAVPAAGKILLFTTSWFKSHFLNLLWQQSGVANMQPQG
jgi:hypothetical protein